MPVFSTLSPFWGLRPEVSNEDGHDESSILIMREREKQQEQKKLQLYLLHHGSLGEILPNPEVSTVRFNVKIEFAERGILLPLDKLCFQHFFLADILRHLFL